MIPGFHQQSRHTVDDHLRNTSDTGSKDGTGRRHALERCEYERLDIRWRHDDIECLGQLRAIGAKPEKMKAVAQAKSVDTCLHGLPYRSARLQIVAEHDIGRRQMSEPARGF